MQKFVSVIKKFLVDVTTSGTHDKFDVERKRRLVFFNILTLIGMLILFVYGINALLGKNNILSIFDLSTFGVLVLIFISVRIRKKFDIEIHLTIVIIASLFLFLLVTGGSDNSGILWVQSFPLISILLLGLRSGIIFAAIFWLLSAVFFFIPGFPIIDYAFNFKLRFLGSFLMMSFFSITYETVRALTQRKLETINKKLQKTSIALLNEKKQTDSIMHNVEEGIFLLNSDLTISSQYSRILEEFLQDYNLAGRSFIALLENKIPEKLLKAVKDYLEMLFRPNINSELFNEINPLDKVELNFEGGNSFFNSKHLEFKFSQIIQENDKIVVISTVKDITEEVELNKKLKIEKDKTNKQMESLFQIINADPEMMNEFILDSEHELDNVKNILRSDEDNYHNVLNQIYQSIHAVKGNAVLLGLNSFSEKLHLIEDEITKLKGKNNEWDSLLELTLKLSELHYEINDIKELLGKVLSFYKHAKLTGSDKKDLLLSAVEKTIEKLSKELGKDIVLISDKYKNNMVSDKHRKIVKDVLIQLTRNAVAHGIETPSLRILKNKEKTGKIYLETEKKDGKLNIFFRDDGVGLDPDIIRKKAKLNETFKSVDIDSLSPTEAIKLIFHPGFSTANTASLSSGRGFGMNVIKSSIEKKGGAIKIKSQKGKSCEFHITLPEN